MPVTSTYRLQLNAGFTLDSAAEIVGYLADLGVSAVYLSPILQARPGSSHGYDVVDPSRVSDDLGGLAALRRFTDELSANGLGQVLDIVPNHVAADSRYNSWWRDVLRNGPSSRYASYFDIDWSDSDQSESTSQTVLVPVLSDHVGRIIEAGQIELRFQDGVFTFRYQEHELPVSPRTVDVILDPASRSAHSEYLVRLSKEFASLPAAGRTDRAAVMERHLQSLDLAEQLAALCRDEPDVAAAIEEELSRVNANADELDALLRRQNYRLARWRTGEEQLDYRRFFNIQSLVGVRVEEEEVFTDTHELVLGWAREGKVDGLRVDHVDGLRDPGGYLQRLHRIAGVYTVVEKILAPEETLPEEWPVDGTTGYDFVSRVNNLMVAAPGEGPLTECYAQLTGESTSYADVVYAAKSQVLLGELAPELERLVRSMSAICDRHRRHRDHTPSELRHALSQVLIAFPVYRTYVQPDRPVPAADRQVVDRAIESVSGQAEIDPELLRFIGELLLLEWPGAAEVDFALTFAQTTSPLMAKGVEDTAFYRYNRLVSLNEVGGDPGVFGRSIERFHEDCASVAQRWPNTMLTLSTHDTKRSADVRARINLLSEIPEQWEAAVSRWFDITESHASANGPDRNARYLFFQTLVGCWPLATERLVSYMDKASKEAKVHTSWADPDEEYDRSVREFVGRALSNPAFISSLEGFLRDTDIVGLGRRSSLVQTALLLTCPGVPDLYQGSEIWDYSLVDPDNRRSVDYPQRRDMLRSVTGAGALPLDRDDAGASKLWLTWRLLQHRQARPQWYASREYEPLEVAGPDAADVVAFRRGEVVVVAGRRATRAQRLGRSRLTLPAGSWAEVLGGASYGGGVVRVSDLLSGFPVAVLERQV